MTHASSVLGRDWDNRTIRIANLLVPAFNSSARPKIFIPNESIGNGAMIKFLLCVHGAAETGRFVPDRRIAVHAGKDANRGGLVLPSCPPDDFLCAPVRAFGVLRRALLVVVGVVPVVDPFPYVAGHVVGAERALARFIAPDGHEGLLSDPPLIEVEMFDRGFDIAPGESAIGGALCRLFPFRFCRESFASPGAIGLGVKPIHIDHGSI